MTVKTKDGKVWGETFEEIAETWPEAEEPRETIRGAAPVANLPAVLSAEQRGLLRANMRDRGVKPNEAFCSVLPPPSPTVAL
jgi:hypothetical protein